MQDMLPPLLYEDILPTRDYLQDVCHVLSSLQRAYLPVVPHDWQYGLEVTMRGISTQPFAIRGEEIRATLDLVAHKVRLDGSNWLLEEYAGSEIFNNVRAWLSSRGQPVNIDTPPLSGSAHYDIGQAEAYAVVLWWMEVQLRELSSSLHSGLKSPILLYPHHFDLAFSWFPEDDERQVSIGFSTGDEFIVEPYVYLTAYPQPEGFARLRLPPPAYWQTKGFTGAVLLYRDLAASTNPERLFQLLSGTFQGAGALFD